MSTKKIVYAAICPICGRAPYSPFRTWHADGKVLAGCVDHFHNGHLQRASVSSHWHSRPEARRIRASLKDMRDGYVTEFAP